MRVLDPQELNTLALRPQKDQPDVNQARRGTLFMRRWGGETAPVVEENAFVKLMVQRDADVGAPVEQPVPFGLAVTIAMPSIVTLYEQVLERVQIPARART